LFTTTPGTKDRQTLELNNFDGAMVCILAALAANSSRGSDIVKQIPRVSSAPGRAFTYLTLPAAIRALRAGKDINYEGVGGPAGFDRNGDLRAAVFNVFTYRDGRQQVLRQIRVKK
jgi:branched-chain amino acid transport system substrate-binding protein